MGRGVKTIKYTNFFMATSQHSIWDKGILSYFKIELVFVNRITAMGFTGLYLYKSSTLNK